MHGAFTRYVLALGTLLGLTLSAARPAAAQELGEAGNLAFALERAFGFYVGSQTVDVGPTEVDSDFTDISLGWNNPPTPLTAPRLSFDYFIDSGFTIGGSFGVFSIDVDVGASDAGLTGVLFTVRGGYALRLSHSISFWPRAGLNYTTLNADGFGGSDRDLMALSLEGMFTLSPADGWAVLLGPTVDLGFSGEVANNDLSETSFGIMVGLLGYVGT